MALEGELKRVPPASNFRRVSFGELALHSFWPVEIASWALSRPGLNSFPALACRSEFQWLGFGEPGLLTYSPCLLDHRSLQGFLAAKRWRAWHIRIIKSNSQSNHT